MRIFTGRRRAAGRCHACAVTTATVSRDLANLQSPAPLVDAAILEANLARIAQAWPGKCLRTHVKAHKCTELARHQRSRVIRHIEAIMAMFSYGMRPGG
jgi:hypothetical protein